jgi:hypothetical protein
MRHSRGGLRPLQTGDDRLHRATGGAKFSGAAAPGGKPGLEAMEGLPRPEAQEAFLIRRLQESQDNAIGKDYLSPFIKDQHRQGNTIQDRGQKRVIPESSRLFPEALRCGPFRGRKMGGQGFLHENLLLSSAGKKTAFHNASYLPIFL